MSSPLGSLLVLGLSACLLCLDDKDANTNLALSQAQRNALLLEPPENTLILALVHHPPEWLSDGRELSAELAKHPHILLSGHMHNAGGGVLHPLGARALLRVSAGASHAPPGRGRTPQLRLDPALEGRAAMVSPRILGALGGVPDRRRQVGGCGYLPGVRVGAIAATAQALARRDPPTSAHDTASSGSRAR